MQTPAENRRFIEKRHHPRVALPYNILLNQGLKSTDISDGGLGIQTSQNLKVGSFLQLNMDLSTEQLSVRARVMRCSPSQSIFVDCNIVGVMFVDLPPSKLIRIRRFIEDLRK